MNKERGFIHISTADLIFFLGLIGTVGWGIGRFIEWVWPYVKAVIHAATA